MATYVILRADDGIFHGEKKKHSSGRRTSQKVRVRDWSGDQRIILCEKIGEQMFDGQHCTHLRLVYGLLKVWQRSEDNFSSAPSGFNFYVPIEVELEETDLGESIRDAAKEIGAKVIVEKEGKNVISYIREIDIEKTLEHGEIIVQNLSDKISFKLSEALRVKKTSEAETLALSKDLAKEYGLKILNERDVLKYEHDPEFNLLSFDFYRNVTGRICIPENKFEQFEKELLKLAEKFHVPLADHNMEVDSAEELHNFSIDSEDLQLCLHKKGKKVEEVFHDHRGQINGTKFGL